MPFTFSHPAAVLPLTKLFKNSSVSSLIVGSIIPDFEYFLRMQVKSIYTHTLSGALTIDIILGIIVLFLYHLLVRNILIENLPSFLQSRFLPYTNFIWLTFFKRNIGIVLLSLFIGIISHLLWDAFTHHNGFIVQKIYLFKKDIVVYNYDIPVYKILQHLSSFVGAVYLSFYVYKMPTSNMSINKKILPYWVLTFIIFIIVFVVACVFLPLTINYLVIIFMSSLIFSIIAASCMYDSLFELKSENG